MAETKTNLEGEKLTVEDTEIPCYSPTDYILYKMDRTVAIVGVIAIAMFSIATLKPDIASQIAIAGISGLIGYVGGRTGK